MIRKQSALTQEWHTLDIPVTHAQLNAWKNGGLIQEVCPNLSPDQRQFILSGVTADEWEKAFGNEDRINPDDLRKIAMTMGKKVLIVEGPQ